jgi:hypothetical protein
MSQSMASAVQLDGSIIFQAEHEEEVAYGDRVLAHQLNGSKATSSTELSPKYLDRELGSDNGAESSTSAAKRQWSDSKRLDLHCEAC